MDRLDPMQVKVRSEGGFDIVSHHAEKQAQEMFNLISESTGVNEPMAGAYLLDSIAATAPFKSGPDNESHVNCVFAYLHAFDCQDSS